MSIEKITALLSAAEQELAKLTDVARSELNRIEAALGAAQRATAEAAAAPSVAPAFETPEKAPALETPESPAPKPEPVAEQPAEPAPKRARAKK